MASEQVAAIRAAHERAAYRTAGGNYQHVIGTLLAELDGLRADCVAYQSAVVQPLLDELAALRAQVAADVPVLAAAESLRCFIVRWPGYHAFLHDREGEGDHDALAALAVALDARRAATGPAGGDRQEVSQ